MKRTVDALISRSVNSTLAKELAEAGFTLSTLKQKKQDELLVLGLTEESAVRCEPHYIRIDIRVVYVAIAKSRSFSIILCLGIYPKTIRKPTWQFCACIIMMQHIPLRPYLCI